MTELVSCAEAARLDRTIRDSAALPELLLMEDASLRLWDALRPIAASLGAGSSSGPLVALCGGGNNAGDVLALFRHARFEGLSDLAVVLGRDDLGEAASVHLASLRALGLPVLSWTSEREACLALIGRAALLVDGIAGTGLDGPLRGGLAELVAAVDGSANIAKRPIASIDLPSGLYDGFHGGPHVEASWTLSIEPRKSVLYAPALRSACGEIIPVDGVFPAWAERIAIARLLGEADIAGFLPPDASDRHKGTRGRLAVFAGSIGSTGAASLTSRSALAAGAGLVALFASPEILPILSSRLESVMVKPEPSESSPIDPERWDALLAGPGWGLGPGRSDRNRALLRRLLGSGMPAVLDADAIRLYRELLSSGFEPSGPLILTPHPGEYEALTGDAPELALADPVATLIARAASLRAVIVLKSHVTWIAAPDGRLAVWEGRESGLATAGSGDVLAGLAGGLLASMAALGRGAHSEGGVPSDAVFSAACAAVAAHGTAGRRARVARGWFEAGDLIVEAGRILGGAR